ncbi:hypothetical protein HA052_04340 [Chromobacterium haemolyticum]|uniref:Uncharacterized protein n=1 Tax=Chromobacterium fluminis TaxID=3044269 RepID=A0ABX0KY11_9NEIS|nr:hypothetical protein [Chromobacterium haemolyticum]NHR04419.1 hypothetical protein [Chromobacterium haemolyticum]
MSSDKKIERGLRDLVFPWIQALGTREGLEQSSDVLARALAKVYVSASSGGDGEMAVLMLSGLVNKINHEIELLSPTVGVSENTKVTSQ